MKKVLTYQEFLNECFDKCKHEEWFEEVLADCYDLDTDVLTISAIVGEIHEGLRVSFDEAVEFFWTVFLINPLIAIKAYQETDLLLGKIDIYGTFKCISPIDPTFKTLKGNITGIYNSSVEYFLIFAIEALLQKDMNPEMLEAINKMYLGGLYNHDKEIMSNKEKYLSKGVELPPKWITHRNLGHILNAIDPHHIIVLLEFFADRYGARLRRGNVGKWCYSKDKFEYIIRFIKNKYGSLSEYIEWDNINYYYHYRRFYQRSMQYEQMAMYIDIVFSTIEDKKRIST